MLTLEARYPQQVPIEAYGNGGFRFAGMSHKGSLLCLPSGLFGWDASAVALLNPDHFARVFAESERIGFLLLGVGRTLAFPSPAIRKAFTDANAGLEVMDTGAAARTYNVLLAEGRPVAAALIAVE
jgi:uncharacterized protein